MTETEVDTKPVPIVEGTTVTKGNYEAVQFNAMKHGILSRLTVLPHEDQDEFADLLTTIAQEHNPVGPTEKHLVDELASIIWRKRRVLQAEGANINQGLRGAACSQSVISSAVPFESGLSGRDSDLLKLLILTPEQVTERQQDTNHDLEMTQEAMAILERGGKKSYDTALKTLLPDSRGWWQELVEEEEYPATAEGLSKFIQHHLEPLCLSMKKEAQHHTAIKAQTLGEGLRAFQLEKLNRYETHLDRKFQRTLSMLVKLKELHSE